jgi:hypothetical protein
MDEYSSLANLVISKELGYKDVKASVSFDKEVDLRKSESIKLDMSFDKSVLPDSDIIISVNMDKITIEKVSDFICKVHKAFKNNEYIFNNYTLFVENKDEMMTVHVTAGDIESGQLTKMLSQEKDSKQYGDIYVNRHKKDK